MIHPAFLTHQAHSSSESLFSTWQDRKPGRIVVPVDRLLTHWCGGQIFRTQPKIYQQSMNEQKPKHSPGGVES